MTFLFAENYAIPLGVALGVAIVSWYLTWWLTMFLGEETSDRKKAPAFIVSTLVFAGLVYLSFFR